MNVLGNSISLKKLGKSISVRKFLTNGWKALTSKRDVVDSKLNINEDGVIILESFEQFIEIRKYGLDGFDLDHVAPAVLRSLDIENLKYDFSLVDMNEIDIQGLDLRNMGLDIDLSKIYFPFDSPIRASRGSVGRYVTGCKDHFVELRNSRLQGNNITGDLSNVQNDLGTCIFCYTEDTFDAGFKNAHPEYFLDKDAPQALKDMYYNLLLVDADCHDRYGDDTQALVKCRPILSLDDYLNNSYYLRGKYLDRFNINRFDYGRIKLIEALGIANARIIIERFYANRTNIDSYFASLSRLSIAEIRDVISRIFQLDLSISGRGEEDNIQPYFLRKYSEKRGAVVAGE